MANSYYPVALNLEAKRCLVAGGGAIATDKVEGLLDAGADVHVVAPQPTARLLGLADDRRITLHRRSYQRTDLDGAYLVYGATDDLAVNARIVSDARAAGILANAVDDIPHCDFFAMAITRRGDLQVAISTSGHSPAFARWVREYLDDWLPDEFGDLLAIVADVRRDVKAAGSIPAYEHWQAAISDDVLLRLRHGDRAGARKRILSVIAEAAASGEPSMPGPGRWDHD